MATLRSPATPARRRHEPFAGYRSPGWIVLLFGGAAVVLVPWIALRIQALPTEHRATHWNVAWMGLDVALALLLLAVAIAALRRSAWLEGAAAAAATLLLTDAWFDVLTSSTRSELIEALAEAALVEIPLAVFSLLLARRAKRRVLQTPARLHVLPQPQQAAEHDRLSA